MQNKGSDTEERSILVDVKLSRGLAVILAFILAGGALIVLLALGGGGAQGSGMALAAEPAAPLAASDGMREYYLSGVINRVCASGYHMASLWEIADPTNLKYNYSLGLQVVNTDLGEGPPTGINGGVRTGYASNSSTTPGQANCYLWTAYSVAIHGTVAKLPDSWTAGAEDMGVWDVTTTTCDLIHSVWCIED